jgi:hypothetical protein
MKKLLLTLISSGFLFADSDYNFIADPYFSPYAGAEDLIITHKLIENSYLERLTQTYQTNPARWAQLARGAELFFFWDPLNYFSMVVQHEVFGHGYRVRNLPDPDTNVIKYAFNLPPPYGPGGAATWMNINEHRTTAFERLEIITGGVEATAIFANRVRMQWLKAGFINPKQSSLYVQSQHDLTRYAAFSSGIAGDDMHGYRKLINRLYSGSKLTRQSLRNQALINFLDPFTVYSSYSWWNYVLRGKQGPLPMIPLGSYRYLPSARLGLTPFGPEYYMENFLVKENKPIYFYLRGGNHAGMNFAGFGIENPNQWQMGSLQLGYRIDLWQQPRIDMQDLRFALSEFASHPHLYANTSESRFGASASLIAQKNLWKEGMLFVQCGAKTKGYVPGESLDHSMIFRVGITLW